MTKLFSLLLFLTPFCLLGQTVDSIKVFTLGEVVISGHRPDSLNSLSAKEMEVFNRLSVDRALSVMPGISLSNVGPRNEAMVHVRGFDLRQVPVFLDGVPVYVPYDGYVDLGRFTTFDLAEIDVAKGMSSVLYGANALGGAINLVSRRPEKKFELSGATGYMSGGYRSNLNIGSRWKKFYVQVGLSRLKRDHFPLSSDFDPTRTEDGGTRKNACRDDMKLSFKVGFTPTRNQEYVIGYSNQQGEKGTPVYAGMDPLNALLSKPRYWQWPEWNKESVYFISNTKWNDSNSIKVRAFYDTFENQLFSYDDDTYSKISRPYAFKSYYDDFTFGGSVEYATRSIRNNDIRLAVHYKQDIHRENNEGEPVRRTEDITTSVGLEDHYRVTTRFSIIPGVNYGMRSSVAAQTYSQGEIDEFPANRNEAFNAQIALSYKIKQESAVSLSAARKTRFATIKDRYSYRLGTAIPNPDLKSESALHLEAGYQTRYAEKFSFQTSFFISYVDDVIQSVSNVEPGKSQMQNKGQAEFYGLEANMEYVASDKVTTTFNYTYIERKNITNPDVHFTDVPNNKLFGSVLYRPFRKSYIVLSGEYNSSRYSTNYGTKTGAFALLHTKVFMPVWKCFSVEGGVGNILDRNYALTEGYPEEGRNYFLNLVYNL